MATSRKKEVLHDYNDLKLENKEFALKAEILFKKYENPFKVCSYCVCLCASEKRYEEHDSMLEGLVTEFHKFINLNQINSIDSPLLTVRIQFTVFNCLFSLKSKKCIKPLINCFSLRSVPKCLVGIISSRIKSGSSIEHLCYIVENMKCGSLINVNNVLLPLFLMNQYDTIEQLLTRELCENSSAFKLKSSINKICTEEYQLSDLHKKYDMKVTPLHRPAITEIQTFAKQLDAHDRRAHSNLLKVHYDKVRSLFRMHYKKNQITLESLVLYSADLAKRDRKSMIKFIFRQFKSYEDYLGAKMFWDKVRGSKVEDHPVVLDLKNRNYSPKRRPVDNENTECYKLNVPLEDVITVATKIQFVEAIEHLQNSKIIPMDLEWKSVRRCDDPERISLLQIATWEKVYLMDTKKLCRILNDDKWQMLGEIFLSNDILKLAYHRAEDDIKFTGISRHLARINNCFDLCDISISLLENHPSIFSYKTVDYKGLSGLVFLCFGKPLDKTEQCSYWDLRPLTTGQMIYAALDAYCLIDVYNYLNEKSEALNISDWKELKPTKDSGSNCSSGSEPKKSQIIIKDPKFVCDNMLQKRYQLMLSNNIDTELVNNKDGHDKCFEFYENEGRIILTDKIIYRRMRCFVPDSHILCIEESDVQKQLTQIQSQFEI